MSISLDQLNPNLSGVSYDNSQYAQNAAHNKQNIEASEIVDLLKNLDKLSPSEIKNLAGRIAAKHYEATNPNDCINQGMPLEIGLAGLSGDIITAVALGALGFGCLGFMVPLIGAQALSVGCDAVQKGFHNAKKNNELNKLQDQYERELNAEKCMMEMRSSCIENKLEDPQQQSVANNKNNTVNRRKNIIVSDGSRFKKLSIAGDNKVRKIKSNVVDINHGRELKRRKSTDGNSA